MKFDQITPQTTDSTTVTQLNEVNMSPGALKKFADSDDAKGIKAGFEAELIFPGLGGDGDDEDNYNEASDERVRDIDDAVNFFSDDRDWYGNGLGHKSQEKLRDFLYGQFNEWTYEQLSSKWEDEGREYLRDNWFDAGSDYYRDQLEEVLQEAADDGDISGDDVERLLEIFDAKPKQDTEMYKSIAPYLTIVDERVEDHVGDVWDNQDTEYDQAREQFEEYYRDDYSESDWLDESGNTHMSDIRALCDRSRHCPVDLYWPSDEPSGGGSSGEFDYDNASDLARDLRNTLDVNARANGDYHSGRPEGTWIFEPDGSLSPDDDGDMPVEIISPPMPLDECLDKIDKFFAWAKSYNAYSNHSTGFHVGVSLPYRGGDVDYVKLALFLGDKYVLEQFDRESNHFCESAVKVIKKHIEKGQAKPADAMELMRHNLIELAHRSIRRNTAKYESINLKGGNYIEFRSAGNEGYNKDPAKMKDIIRRYAYAMYIAGNPAAERQEYYKKLYKLLDAKHNDVLKLFAEYSTGLINKDELKAQWVNISDRQTHQAEKRKYYVTVPREVGGSDRTHEVLAHTPEEAAAQIARRPEYSHIRVSNMRVTTDRPTRGDLAHKIRQNLTKRTFYVRQDRYPYEKKKIQAVSREDAERIAHSLGGSWAEKLEIKELYKYRVTDNLNELPPVTVEAGDELDAWYEAEKIWSSSKSPDRLIRRAETTVTRA